MVKALYLIGPLALSVIFLVRAEFRKRRKWRYILKPLSTLIVILMALLSLLEPSPNLNYTIGVLVALFFSMGGDIALMFSENPRAFRTGLVFFLLAHIRYTILFVMMGAFGLWDILTAVLIIAAGILFYRLIRPNLGAMKGAVILYMLVISVMLSRAIAALWSPDFTNIQALMIASGAFLFYISDVILAANRYWKPWQYNRISLAFYYSGQMLIALAASYFI